ncbi:MAG: TIGR04283 family arsenosugar biosynthesis glycosyltransferase, partial [Verrucomicrobiota bacterium]|nr:TIGR04283 family arsenosugar biosynthesis glycosyltransferase [Verrucomicrobiota bacterium]
WAGLGGIMFLREEKLFEKNSAREIPQKISVVIPTWNEEKNLPETVRHLRAIPEISEIIVVDGGSSDKTCEMVAQLNCRLLSAGSSRGAQMRLGAAAASGEAILLVHADTWLPPGAGCALQNCLRDKTVVAGGFWKVFRQPAFLLRGSKTKCFFRLFLGGRLAGDQAIFVRREALEKIGGVPALPLMEEFELCKRLRKVGRLALADATVETSARRFFENGVLRTYLRMWRVTIKYFLGSSAEDLRELYEKK